METGTVLDTIRREWPHGHPEFIPTVLSLIALHSAKNYDYARGGDPLGNFGRVSEMLSKYHPMSPAQVAMTYAMKQVDAVLWAMSQGGENKVEGVVDRLRDVAVYAILAIIMLQEESHAKVETTTHCETTTAGV